MKPLTIAILLLIAAMQQPLAAQTSAMTYNIRMSTPADGVNAWPNRKNEVIAFLREAKPAILCMQEVLDSQLQDLITGLPDYGWFGVGREDGVKQGEAVPVFYLKDRYTLLKGGHFWLSEEPHQPGKPAWDAACTRMVSWVQLKANPGGDTLFVFNTHFDHVGVKARKLSARLLVKYADSLAGRQPVIITGDFNASPADAPYGIITSAGFKDSRVISETPPKGPEYTFTGFDVKGKPGERIDYIYLKNTGPVKTHTVRNDKRDVFKRLYYLSDHLPVLVRF
jgi:endonuclease/exonuclease/phosphatase family metal-dependent hydrolase